jgi:O-antigen/teichoic acid export membrane protein
MLSGLPKIFLPIIVIFFTILITKNVVWILFAYFFSNLLLSIGGYFFLVWWFKIKGSPEGVAETVRYGKQMSALGFFQLASGQIDQLLLFHFVGPAQLAIYTLALAPIAEVQNFLNNFLTVLFPKIASKTAVEVHKMLPTRIRQMFFISALLTVVYILAVPFLFKYVFPKYVASIFVTQVLAFVILLQPKNIIDTFFTAHGQVANRSKIILISQAIEFLLFFILIPFFGLWGAVVATVTSEVCAAITFIWIYFRIRKSDLQAAAIEKAYTDSHV